MQAMQSATDKNVPEQIPADVVNDLEEHGYTPIKLIGKGGFANCYLVYSHQYDHNFACKILTVQEDAQRMTKDTFTNEFTALTRTIHSYIIKIYNTFSTINYETRTRKIYLILEYCDQGDLENYILTKGPITNEQKLLECILMMLESLRFLETNNIAHNDIKPSNFLIDQYNRIKLTDFGLSKIIDEKSSISTDFIGSVPFLAPEIVTKKPYNPLKSDVWSFGVTVFFIATGKYPFNYQTLKILKESQSNGVVTFPSTMSSKIRSIIVKCLQNHPGNRASFSELYDIVKKAVEVNPKPMTLQNNLINIQKYHKTLNLSYTQPKRKIVIPHCKSCLVLRK